MCLCMRVMYAISSLALIDFQFGSQNIYYIFDTCQINLNIDDLAAVSSYENWGMSRL